LFDDTYINQSKFTQILLKSCVYTCTHKLTRAHAHICALTDWGTEQGRRSERGGATGAG